VLESTFGAAGNAGLNEHVCLDAQLHENDPPILMMLLNWMTPSNNTPPEETLRLSPAVASGLLLTCVGHGAARGAVASGGHVSQLTLL